MKNADIKQHLLQIIDRLPEEVRVFVEGHCFIAGGAFWSILNNKVVNDYDFYFFKEEDITKFVKLVLKHFNVFPYTSESDYAITFTHKKIKYQFITCVYGSPKDVVAKFDFMHTMNYYNLKTDKLNLDYKAFCTVKLLCFNPKSEYPVAALGRVLNKFVPRGQVLDDTQFLKIILKINSLDMSSFETLKGQLYGLYVDKDRYKECFQEIKSISDVQFSNKVSSIIDG